MSEKPLQEGAEWARRGAVIQSLMVATHSDWADLLGLQIDNLHWLAVVLAATENEVRPDVDRFLANLKKDHAAWHEMQPTIAELQRAAIHNSKNVNELSERGRHKGNKLEASLDSRQAELSEIIERVAKLSGSRIPPIPPQLIRPNRMAPVLNALQRLAAGYSKEKLRK